MLKLVSRLVLISTLAPSMDLQLATKPDPDLPGECTSTSYALITRYDYSKSRMKLPCPRTDMCDVCLQHRKKKLYALCRYGAELLGDPLKFLTLTIPDDHQSEFNTPTSLAKDLTSRFRKLRRSLQKLKPYKGTEYFCVLEFGSKNMRPHLHFIIYDPNNVFPECPPRSAFKSHDAWLSAMTPAARAFYDKLTRHGLGYYHAEQIMKGPGGAAAYLSKYMSKSIQAAKPIQKLKNLRLYNTSRGWPRTRPEPKLYAYKLDRIADYTQEPEIESIPEHEPVRDNLLDNIPQKCIQFQLDSHKIRTDFQSFLSDVKLMFKYRKACDRYRAKLKVKYPHYVLHLPKSIHEYSESASYQAQVTHIETEQTITDPAVLYDEDAITASYLRKHALLYEDKLRGHHDYTGSIAFLRFLLSDRFPYAISECKPSRDPRRSVAKPPLSTLLSS